MRINWEILRINWEILRINWEILRINWKILRINWEILRINWRNSHRYFARELAQPLDQYEDAWKVKVVK